MSTKAWLVRMEEPRRALRVERGGTVAFLVGRCPLCDVDAPEVQGKSMRISPDDRAYEADGYAQCCGKWVGTIRAEVSTLFGLREDHAVLHGRARVY